MNLLNEIKKTGFVHSFTNLPLEISGLIEEYEPEFYKSSIAYFERYIDERIEIPNYIIEIAKNNLYFMNLLLLTNRIKKIFNLEYVFELEYNSYKKAALIICYLQPNIYNYIDFNRNILNPEMTYIIELKDDNQYRVDNFIRENKLKNIIFYGDITNLCFCFLMKTYIVNVSYSGLRSLKKVNKFWMSNCSYLKNIDFIGLASLEEISNDFLSGCDSLTDINFNGLNNVKKIGDYWLSSCNNLINTNFNELNNLESIGDYWLSSCKNLIKPNFLGLNNLNSIGDYWMSNCLLVNPNFILNRLEKIGNFWMFKCISLIDLNFNGLKSLKEIGDYALFSCINLKNPNFSELINIKKIGNYFMNNCNNLENPNINIFLSKKIVYKESIDDIDDNELSIGKYLMSNNILNEKIINFISFVNTTNIDSYNSIF